MLKKLYDSVVRGFGFTAGSVLLEQAVKKVKDELREPTEEEQRAEEARAKKARADDDKRLAEEAKVADKERRRAEEERRRTVAKTEAEIDDELAAMKKRLGKR